MGQRVIPVAVTAEYIGGDGVTLGAAGSHNSVLIEYDFRSAGPQWDDISGRYILWTNPQGNSTNRINLGVSEKVEGYEGVYQAAPPADAMCVPGWAEMVVVGFTMDGDKEVTKIKTEPSRFRVLPGSSRAADNEGIAPTVADQLQAEIEAVEARKVNKPVSPHDKDGEPGQVLESMGGGQTRWRDETVATKEVVDEVLRDHPDWVTTVEDASISDDKLTEELRETIGQIIGLSISDKFKSQTIMPIYIGDYICYSKLPSCCIKVGDYFYGVQGLYNDDPVGTNDGNIRKFSISQNMDITPVEGIVRPVGHANGIAHDPVNHIIYIAPTKDYSTEGKPRAKYLYMYDEDFTYIGQESIPTGARGVSYDHKTGRLYYMDADLFDIYIKTGSSWAKYTTLDIQDYIDAQKWLAGYQDFAVYDDCFYLGSQYCIIHYGKLTEGASRLEGTFSVSNMDSFGRFMLGELEGMEFSPEGHLFATMFQTLYGPAMDAFIVELPVGTTSPHKMGISDALSTVNYGVLELSDEARKQFRLNAFKVRTINQLSAMTYKDEIYRIDIPEGEDIVESVAIRIGRSLRVEIGGHLTCKQFIHRNGTLNLYAKGKNNLLKVTANDCVIYSNQNGNIIISGETPLNIDAPNLINGILVYEGNHRPLISLRKIPVSIQGTQFKIGDVSADALTVPGLYYGATQIV